IFGRLVIALRTKTAVKMTNPADMVQTPPPINRRRQKLTRRIHSSLLPELVIASRSCEAISQANNQLESEGDCFSRLRCTTSQRSLAMTFKNPYLFACPYSHIAAATHLMPLI